MIFQIDNIDQLRKNKQIRVVRALDIAFNRKAIDQKLIDILVLPSLSKGQDSLKYLDAGLNSIALRAASKNKVAIGIDIDNLRSLSKKDLAAQLARIAQTIELCRKCQVLLAYTGQRDKLNARALLCSLGASTNQAARAISF